MTSWLPPFLGGSVAVLILWIALGVQRYLARRRNWWMRTVRELRAWDGRLPDDVELPSK